MLSAKCPLIDRNKIACPDVTYKCANLTALVVIFSLLLEPRGKK
jgi:hypothetical protein